MVYVTAAAVIVISVIVILRYMPLRREIKELSQISATQRFIIEKAATESSHMEALKAQLEALKEQTASYDLALPSDRDLGTFLQQIADLMDEHKLTDQQVQPGKKLEDGKLSCIPIEMNCKGKLQEIYEFHKALCQLQRLIRIDSVELVNNEKLNGQVRMTAKTRIYYRIVSDKG